MPRSAPSAAPRSLDPRAAASCLLVALLCGLGCAPVLERGGAPPPPALDPDGGVPRDGATERAADGGPDASAPDDGGFEPTGDGGAPADAGAGAPTCEERPLFGQGSLSHWVRKTTGANSCSWHLPTSGVGLNTEADCRFFDMVWPRVWPGSQNARNLTTAQGETAFIAMELDSGAIPSDWQGRMTQEVAQFGEGGYASSGAKMWSISRCPGDFNRELIDAEMGPGCIRHDAFGATQSFNWGGASFRDDPRRCALQPNTRYYLNIVWTLDVAGTPPDAITLHPNCETNRCGGVFVPGGLYAP